jgi:hypothetical protein
MKEFIKMLIRKFEPKKVKLTFTEAKEYFKDKEISPQEYLYYQGVLMTAMKKQDYKRLFECLKQKPNSSVFEFKEA